MTQMEWPGARVRAAFNEFFQSKAHTYWASNAVVSRQQADYPLS
jgi:alanyl-tRNA synthetase